MPAMDDSHAETMEKALALLEAVYLGLILGARHYSVDGRLLRTATEILAALNEDGQITIVEADQVQ